MKRILVVDDSPSVRLLVGQALGSAGFEVVEAGDGVEGIERIGRGDLALVLCDVNMPRMDGLEMIERVKQDPVHRGLPIVMLSSEGQPTLVDRAKRAGAKGWIVKPFRPELLVSAVSKLLAA